MRFLVLDHYFSQDLESLTAAAGNEISFDVMPFEDLRAEALRVFPMDVARGLEAFARPELADARRRYAEVLREIIEDRFTSAPFDGIVFPSDVFFYVRAAPAVAHALGVPLVVVQKETTLSDYTMRVYADVVRRYAPPIADRMTVCSERQREFWVRAGADPAGLVVTGQPRFDFYLKPDRWPVPDHDRPVALFLSYAVNAYRPDNGRDRNPWALLHRQTEAGLHELARQGWRVLIKPHPQQSSEHVRAWRARAGELWGRTVCLVDPGTDVRKLIVTADVVVGFQSTALLEAMLAGRPTVYTGWDRRAIEIRRDLIPFQEWHRDITVLVDPAELAPAVASLRGREYDGEALRRRRALAARYLGPLDGGASERVVSILAADAADWRTRRDAAATELRRRLTARRPPLRLSRRTRAGLRTTRRRIGTMLGR